MPDMPSGPAADSQAPQKPSAGDKPPQGDGGTAGPPPSQAAPQKVTIDLDGAPRDMTLDEIAEAVKKAKTADEALSTARKLMVKNTAIEALADAWQKMPPDKQRLFNLAMRNPELLDRMVHRQQEAPVDDPFEDPFDTSHQAPQRRNGGDDASILRAELNELRQMVAGFVAKEQGRSLRDSIEKEVGAYSSVYERLPPEARNNAISQLMIQATARQGTPLDQIVAEQASLFAGFLKGSSANPTAPAQGGSGVEEGGERSPYSPPRQMTAKDLNSGSILDEIAKTFGR